VDEAWRATSSARRARLVRIGDTLTEDRTIAYDEIPLSSGSFHLISIPTQLTRRIRAGLEQLLRGRRSVFTARNAPSGTSLLAAVGRCNSRWWNTPEGRVQRESRLTPRVDILPGSNRIRR